MTKTERAQGLIINTGVRVRGGARVGGRPHLAGKVVGIGGVELGSVGQLLGLVSQGRWELQLCKWFVKLALDVLGAWHLCSTQWALVTVPIGMLYCSMNARLLRQNKTGETLPYISLLRQMTDSSTTDLLTHMQFPNTRCQVNKASRSPSKHRDDHKGLWIGRLPP